MKGSDSAALRLGRDFRAGEVLFREGESGSDMFVIQSGLVQITKRIAGEERPIAALGRGEFVGELAILLSKPRTATATVVEDGHFLVIDPRTLETMIASSAEIAIRLIKKLASRLEAADALVQILVHPDPKARVLLGMKRHAESFGERTAAGVVVHLTAQTLAREVGSSTTDVSDVFRRLQRLGIMSVAAEGTLVLQDEAALHELLDFVELPRRFEAT